MPEQDPSPTLTEVERDVLDFERQWWKYAGAKEAAIHDRFGWSPTRHSQVVNALIDRPEALAHAPLIVRRLQRLRDERRNARTNRSA
ncbi:DUF3263 domain-containing protein [Nocardioides sp. R-C-SC26]|uniref:DUF3263 domain-containing protein n=1 Tax=Nocardioides sp. R-C-SC26 TaxID=2870414 RepID=UPI001E343BE6|nr:DUF3263 domain-containing protein [Nocardioides sp. R-C-SC26]